MTSESTQAPVSSGGYDGAGMGRVMRSWLVNDASADNIVAADLQELRNRSNDAYRNTPIAASAIRTPATNVVGSGLTMQSRIDRKFLGMSDDEADDWQTGTEREYRLWANSPECDAAGIHPFGGLQRLAYLSAFTSGDSFALLPMRKSSIIPYSLRVNLIEGHQVSTPAHLGHDASIVEGIKKRRGGGVELYYIASRHPGSRDMGPVTWRAIPPRGKKSNRRNIIHLFDPDRIGQNRGLPYLSPVLSALKQITRLTDAELMAAVVTAMLTVFVKKDGPTGNLPPLPGVETGDAPRKAELKKHEVGLGSGNIIDLATGEDVEIVDPKRPNAAFDPFFIAIVKQIGAALEQPAEIILKEFNKSYSASRAAFLQAWQFYRRSRSWLATYFCQPIYEEWLTEAVIIGRVKAPGFLDDPAIRAAYCGSEWHGPVAGQIDPLDEVLAAEKRVENDFSTRAKEATELTGTDIDKNIAQRIKEERAREKGGLKSEGGPVPSAITVNRSGRGE